MAKSPQKNIELMEEEEREEVTQSSTTAGLMA